MSNFPGKTLEINSDVIPAVRQHFRDIIKVEFFEFYGQIGIPRKKFENKVCARGNHVLIRVNCR